MTPPSSRPGRRGTIALTWGPTTPRTYLCRYRISLGRITLTYIPNHEIEHLMDAWIERTQIVNTLRTGWLPDGDPLHIENDGELSFMNTPSAVWVEGLSS